MSQRLIINVTEVERWGREREDRGRGREAERGGGRQGGGSVSPENPDCSQRSCSVAG